MGIRTNNTSDQPAQFNDIPGVFDFDIPGAGLVLDLDASVVSSIAKNTNGTTVTTWTDQKNGLVATSANNTTTYQMGGLKFDGADYLEIPIFAGLDLTSAMSIFVVATCDDVTTNPTGHFICRSSGATGYQFRYTTTPDGDARLNLAGVADINAGVTSWESGIRASIGVTFGSNLARYQKNGAQLSSTKNFGASGNSASVTTRIGATNSGSEFFVGTLYKILIYNTEITGSNLTNIGAALVEKWRT